MSSVELASFLEPVKVGGSRIHPTRQAYKMDGTKPNPDMRASVGLGTCNCCDYFAFLDAKLVLIEETRLRCQIEDLRKCFAQDIQKDVVELDEHEWKRVNQRVLRRLRQENKLKVYGSLLVLCRLAKALGDGVGAKALASRASFWLVYSESAGGDDVIFFDSLKGRLASDLRSALTGEVVGEVEILPVGRLATKLPATPMVP